MTSKVSDRVKKKEQNHFRTFHDFDIIIDIQDN